MQDTICMEKGEGLSNVIVDVDLHVIGKAGLGQFQKVSEGVVHQLHQKNGQARCRILSQAQILHYVRVADLAEEAALLLEHLAVPGPVKVHQDGVEEFGRARQLAERGLTHLAVRSLAEGRVSQQTNAGAETEGPLCVCRHIPAALRARVQVYSARVDITMHCQ